MVRSPARLALLSLPLVTLLLAACGDDSTDSKSTSVPSTSAPAATAAPDTTLAPDTTPAPSGAADVQLADSALGSILVDGSGRTLYLFTKDTPTTSACTGDCATNWPSLTMADAPALGEGLDAEDFGSIAAADGSQHVTFYGHPLYFFAGDQAPGDTNGQGVGSVWFAVDVDGNAVKG